MIRPVDQRILVGTPATLTWQPIDYNGAKASPAGTITVGITKANGDILVAAGTATSGSTDNPRTYSLSAANNASLERLTVTWTDGTNASTHTTFVEVVGAYYFLIDDLRDQSGVTDEVKFPDSKLIDARRQAEELIENATGVAWVPRYERQRARANGTSQLRIDWPQLRSVRSARNYTSSTNYSTLSAGDLASIAANDLPFAVLSNGNLWIKNLIRWQNVLIEYEHGFDAPPTDLKDAALQYARYLLLGDSKRISPRALDVTSELGTIRYSQPGDGRPTGIPDVDAIIMARSRRTSEVAE